MLKRGIVSLDQLDRPLTWLGKKKHANLLLLADLFRQPAPDARHYDTIISQVITPNGTWKESCTDRFATLDRLTLATLAERWPGRRQLVITDLGASSGATSVQLFQLLRERFSLDFLATDLCRDAIAVRPRYAKWVIVFDADGRALQHVFSAFVLPGQGQESALYPINRALRALSRRLLVPKAAAVFSRCDARTLADFETIAVDRYKITKIPLLSYHCLRLLRECQQFRFEVVDVMQPLSRCADVIRVMNVLTPVYFDEARLRAGIGNCAAALNPGGLLILGRSPMEDPANAKATIYLNDAGAIRPLHRLNGGYEAHHLVEGTRAAA